MPTRKENLGMRVGIDFASALLIGTLLGRWVDQLLGIRPFGLIFFILLGCASGFLTTYRLLSRL